MMKTRTLADAARANLLPNSSIITIRENGDEGFALAEMSGKKPFLLGMLFHRTTNDWTIVQMSTVPAWSALGQSRDEGIMPAWGYAPVGADRVRVEFAGEARDDEVRNGIYLLIWWRAPKSPDPFVQAFRINGEWIEQERPPSLETAEVAFVSVFEQPTQYFLHTSQYGREIGLQAARPSLALPLDTPDAKLGEAVLYLMTECRRDAQPPASRDHLRKETLALYKPARVRSWAALQRTAKLVHVWLGGEGLRVEPTRNAGYRGPDRGFHYLPEQAERLERWPQPATLGASVRRALSASTLPPFAPGDLTRA